MFIILHGTQEAGVFNDLSALKYSTDFINGAYNINETDELRDAELELWNDYAPETWFIQGIRCLKDFELNKSIKFCEDVIKGNYIKSEY